ncbi:hypothetical protein [Pseudomonas lini]|uniref:hypothetical protein n=1 Tax=Pseudomonas lini TaxID=163011 RepID=UPI0012E16C32|nr:hypothetical protein [Pseudomonas lini]
MKTVINLLKDPELRSATLELVGTVIDMAVSSAITSRGSERGDFVDGAMPYGLPKKNGSHNHAYNMGEDRTPAQKAADIRRRKS